MNEEKKVVDKCMPLDRRGTETNQKETQQKDRLAFCSWPRGTEVKRDKKYRRKNSLYRSAGEENNMLMVLMRNKVQSCEY